VPQPPKYTYDYINTCYKKDQISR